MRTTLLLILLTTFATFASADETPIWTAVADAHGYDAWKKVKTVKFTWKHVKSGNERSYDWDRSKRRVKVTMDGETFDIPTSGKSLEGDELAAHKAFINDSYWMLFELKAVEDDVERTDLGEADSPFGGQARAYRIEYPSEGGYTPGDAYVVYLGQDGRSVGWSYYPSGAKLPKLSSLRGGLTTVAGVTVPTRFETPEGGLFIEITGVEMK